MDTTTAPTPPDSPASANRTGATWVAGTGAFLLLAAAALAAGTGSIVLTWTAALGAVAAAAGVAAVSPIPAPLLLSLAAAVTVSAGRGGTAHGTANHPMPVGVGGRRSLAAPVHARLALLWAALAGLAPVVGVASVAAFRSGGRVGAGVLTELGLAGGAAWVALASGA